MKNDDYIKKLIASLHFIPRENSADIFIKKYADGSVIELDFAKNEINYGDKIVCESKNTCNFSQPENFVVLECVNRLLEKGYKPENITLEKTWAAGHGTSGRLDICVAREDASEYLLIECKTYGGEFDKAVKKLHKDGGQLFTYFKFSNKADIIMLYASELVGNEIVYKNEIIKIEDDYRTGDVKDFYEKWNKLTISNRDFDDLQTKNKIFTKKDLKELTETEGTKLFNGFASILRKHSVSDKPNAFNVIFNLFLAKLRDEAKPEDKPLDFCWQEGEDPVDFQVRLYNLHKDGLKEFLRKEIEGIEDKYFKTDTDEDLKKAKKKFLKFNKLFDIKSVLDDDDFEQNHRVLKEVVQLIEKYQIRYPRKQRYLSDFFELLLTTGLKQEAGQYFTPPPITKFITRSIPIKKMVEEFALKEEAELPAVMDYAVGSGHFITEVMEEIQNTIASLDTKNLGTPARQTIEGWKTNPYSWAAKYIYGIEKDYRLVKVAKVGCYFYGDGLAQIIHGDGLDSLLEPKKNYVGLLSENTNLEDSTKAKFSLVLSNPPYSVKNSKDDIEYIGSQNEFSLYQYLTDNSSEIECLFIERTKQLLKDGGIAGIILPSSILSNTGIYTKAREIILQYFEIIAITELGSNTFMATGTNTVVLFLKRRNNYVCSNLKNSINTFFTNYQDITVNGIENPFSKYIAHVWENVSFDDYVSLVKQMPNETIQQHEIYKEYRKKIKAKNDLQNTKGEKEFWHKLIETEKEKLLYFVLAYPQKIVLIKSGEKDADLKSTIGEKRFLGYEFSNRRGSEGIHPIQRGKTIDECTKLFDAEKFDNPQKASTYIYKAFGEALKADKAKAENKFYKKQFPAIDESLQKNISYINLVDALTFDRVDFEKTISTAVKKKVKIESKYPLVLVSNAITKVNGSTKKIEQFNILENGKVPVITQEKDILISGFSNEKNPITDFPIILFGDHSCTLKYIDFEFFRGADGTVLIKPSNDFLPKYFFFVLNYWAVNLIVNKDKYERHNKYLQEIQIPLPPLDIQQKIVAEIEQIETKEKIAKGKIAELKGEISALFNDFSNSIETKLEDISILLKRGKSANYGKSNIQIIKSGQARGYKDFDFSQKYFVDENFVLDERKLEKGDVLINSTGVGTAGRVTLFNLDGNFVVDSHITILRLNKNKAIPDFVLQSLAKIGFKNIEAMATGQSGQIELSLSIIQNIKIPLPPISEQKKIVAQIEEIEQKIAVIENSIEKVKAEKEAVLTKYL